MVVGFMYRSLLSNHWISFDYKRIAGKCWGIFPTLSSQLR
jgi:hypothetical protein